MTNKPSWSAYGTIVRLPQFPHGVPTTLEQTAVLAAGLQSSPWQHIDTTSTRVDGANQQCHVLCNPLYTVYTTLPQRDRLHVLDVLRGGTPRSFRLDASAKRLMRLMDVPARDQHKLAHLPRDQDLSEAELTDYLATYGKGIGG